MTVYFSLYTVYFIKVYISLKKLKKSTFTKTEPAFGPLGAISTIWRGHPLSRQWLQRCSNLQGANGCIWSLLCPHTGTLTTLGAVAGPAQVTQLPMAGQGMRTMWSEPVLLSPHSLTSAKHRRFKEPLPWPVSAYHLTSDAGEQLLPNYSRQALPLPAIVSSERAIQG